MTKVLAQSFLLHFQGRSLMDHFKGYLTSKLLICLQNTYTALEILFDLNIADPQKNYVELLTADTNKQQEATPISN
jgi:hypothetical protein